MKKFLIILAAVCAVAFSASGCARKTDYIGYVSEKRTNVFLYDDSETEIKIHCSEREQPYAADGIKGAMNDLIEIFVKLPKNPGELEVKVQGLGGEMNYRAVNNDYYLNFSAKEFTADSVDVTLIYGGEEHAYKALSVRYAGIMTCDEAVKCVVEHDAEYFENLTENGVFKAEIYVRLLFDESCYYYVGVCDREGNIQAYLLDGENGKIIAVKHLHA